VAVPFLRPGAFDCQGVASFPLSIHDSAPWAASARGAPEGGACLGTVFRIQLAFRCSALVHIGASELQTNQMQRAKPAQPRCFAADLLGGPQG